MGGKKPPLPKMCHAYLTMMKLGSYTLPKTDPKNIWITWDIPWVLVTSGILHQKSANFAISRKYMYRLHFDTKFLVLLTFLESLKIVLIRKVTIFMISAKMATPGLLKITIFWNKGYDVIISVHDVTNKILSGDSNLNVDVVMWPNFGNFNISMRKVTIISILQGFDQKNCFFCGVVLVQVQQFGTGTRYELWILHHCGKRVKTKNQKFLWVSSYVCRSYRRKNW